MYMTLIISPVRRLRRVFTGSYFTHKETVYAHSHAVDREEQAWFLTSRYESNFTRSGNKINFSQNDSFQDMVNKILIAEFLSI